MAHGVLDVWPFEGESVATTRLSMRKIRDIVQLHHAAALSNRAIARAITVSASMVGDCLA